MTAEVPTVITATDVKYWKFANACSDNSDKLIN